MSSEIERPQADTITPSPLLKPTFRAIVRRLVRLTSLDETADYSLRTLSAEHGIELQLNNGPEHSVGRRWRYPPVVNTDQTIRYEVTTYDPVAQQILKRELAKKLVASVWFETRRGNQPQTDDTTPTRQAGWEESGGEFSFLLELLDDERKHISHQATMSGQLRLSADLRPADRDALFTDAESAGAGLVFDYYERRDSSTEPLEFLADVSQEVGKDMVSAFGMLSTIDQLP